MKEDKKLPVIFVYQVLRASESITHRLIPSLKTNNSVVSRNLNITTFAFIIQCF